MDGVAKKLMVTMLVSFGKGCVTGGDASGCKDASAAAIDRRPALPSNVSFPDSLLEDWVGEIV